MGSLLAAFRLVRLPNTLTAVADVMAGAAIAGLNPLSANVLLAGIGSGLLYGGGIALNDLWDLEKDRRDSPDRILVRGDLSTTTAGLLVGGLMVAGGATALLGGAVHTCVTLALVLAIIIYDVLPDRFHLTGAAVMGSCRALNLARGLSLAPVFPVPLAPFALGGHLWLIFFVTLVSTFEGRAERGATFRAAVLLLPLPYLVPALGNGLPSDPNGWVALLLAVLLGVYVVTPGLKDGRPIPVVLRAVFTLVLFDALYALSTGRTLAALVCAAFLPTIRLLARLIGQRGS